MLRRLWQEMPINGSEPLIMHVDMNSCFATMEQQANPLLRGRPVAVAAYTSPWGCIIAPSIEAKRRGVKTGMRVREGQACCPGLIIIQSHPPLYRDAYLRFKRIFESYTDKVTPKSIDEAIIDFHGSQVIRRKRLVDLGYEIKQRVRDEVGEWVRVNIGIGTNRFLAKTAANLHKPDGLDVITKDNLLDVYAGMSLIDITGINRRYEARLRSWGIGSPLEFFDTPVWKLRKQVFKSIAGYYWHLKMRGWEIEDYESRRQSIGHNYTLQDRTNDPYKLSKIIMKLCEKTGRRLRRNNSTAGGIHVWVLYEDHSYWHHGERTGGRMYTTQEIYYYAMKVLKMRPYSKVIIRMGVTVFGLLPYEPLQLGLFDGEHGDKRELSRSLDAANDRHGDMVVGSALLEGMAGFILDRIAFGSVKDIQDLYDDE